MTLDQLDLFTEREHRALGAPPVPNRHGVFEPDETLTLASPGRYGMATAEIDLVHVPAFGWIFATSYHLGDCGASSPLMLDRADRGDSRRDALVRAVDQLCGRMDGYLQCSNDSATRKATARKVKAWARGLLA